MRSILAGLVVALTAVFAAPALAHHPLDGMPMETVWHGVLSGIGHPVLGFDHLFFVVAMGAVAALSGTVWRGIASYIGAMLLGCLAVSFGQTLPVQEVVVTLSLICVGLLIASQRQVSTVMLLAIFAGFGLFHGAAFGGSMAAQEGGAPFGVLAGYLTGLGITQFGLALAASITVRNMTPLRTRLGGAMVAGAGLLLFLEQIEGFILA